MDVDTQHRVRPVLKDNPHLYLLILALVLMLFGVGYGIDWAACIAAFLSLVTAVWHFLRR